MLASPHMHLDGSLSLSQKIMTQFYHNISMQALSISNDKSMSLKFDVIVDLVKKNSANFE